MLQIGPISASVALGSAGTPLLALVVCNSIKRVRAGPATTT